MKICTLSLITLCAAVLIITSCTTAPDTPPAASSIQQPSKDYEMQKRLLPPQFSDILSGGGRCTQKQLAAFFLSAHPAYPAESIETLAALYISECNLENINSDIAFCQMCHETGYLTFGNLVTADMNNFCGLGAISAEQRGCVFATQQDGVRAHIQHLKAYASAEALTQDCIDPRYKYVTPKGKSPSFYGLAGTWAADKTYGRRLEEKLIRLYTMSGFIAAE